MSTQADIQPLIAKANEIGQAVKEHLDRGDCARIVSHLDADGLAAASILGKAIRRCGAAFHIRIAKQLDEETVSEIAREKPSLVIFTDFGSGYLDLLSKLLPSIDVVVLDHHQPLEISTPSSIKHLNPHLFGFDGARDISAAGVSYLLAKEIDVKNVDLSALSVVGALGDLQDKNEKRELHGLNEMIVRDGINSGKLRVETDLILYGRETRPLHKAFASTTNPFIPGLSGEEDESFKFLVKKVGLELKVEERWRTLADLNEDEKQRLFTQIVRHLVQRKLPPEISKNLQGTVYTLTGEDKWTPLRDAREYASLLNACGRMGKFGLGVSVGLGSRGRVLDEAQEVLSEYRRTLAGYMRVLTTAERVTERKNLYHINGDGLVEEKMLGAVASLLSVSGVFGDEKPLLATTSTASGEIKVSARASDRQRERGLNLNAVMMAAAEKLSGRGGGHDVAAGATIPKSGLEQFIDEADSLIERMWKGGEK
jgi:RecJ-like exonuclease